MSKRSIAVLVFAAIAIAWTSAGDIKVSGSLISRIQQFYGTTGTNFVKLPDNVATALTVEDFENGGDLLTISTTNGSENITFAKPVVMSSTLTAVGPSSISGASGSTGLTVTSHTTGVAIYGIGAANKAGVFGLGGDSNGGGVVGHGGASDGNGVYGRGDGTGAGVGGVGGDNSGGGVVGNGGSPNGPGGYFTGTGTGAGSVGLGGPTGGVGGYFVGGAESGYGCLCSSDTTTPTSSALRLVPQDTNPVACSKGDVFVCDGSAGCGGATALRLCTATNTWTTVGP